MPTPLQASAPPAPPAGFAPPVPPAPPDALVLAEVLDDAVPPVAEVLPGPAGPAVLLLVVSSSLEAHA
jgi:hypothetical protein